jgi:acyl dehydratase
MTTEVHWAAPFERLVEGASFETRGRTITESDVVAFCAQTGDWHPQHSDREWAAGSQFGERIAHGMLVLSSAVGLVPFEPERVLALRRIADVVFKRPVHLGDTIRVRGLLTSVQEVSDDAGLVGFAWTIVNQDSATVARARVELLWRRDAPPVPDPFEVSDNGFVPLPL